MIAAHTTGRLTYRENGDANSYALLDESGKWCVSLLLNGEQFAELRRANMRRLAACWNACDGVTTEYLESLTQSLPAVLHEAEHDLAHMRAERDIACEFIMLKLDLPVGDPCAAIKAGADHLIKAASILGVVLTVSQVNRWPPAMGNYDTVAEVRPARGHY